MIPIRADLLVGKLNDIRSGEYRRIAKQIQENGKLVELLWFIQAMSIRPEGINGFALNFIAKYGQRFAVWQPLEYSDDFVLMGGQGTELNTSAKSDFEQQIRLGENPLGCWLNEICVNKSFTFDGPRYACNLVELLLEELECHRERALKSIADTEVKRIAFHWLDFACSSKTPVQILGYSRYGKTEAVRAWCDSRPGVARLVTVPESNRERDFFAAHADALGIDYSLSTSPMVLRDKVEFVLRHTGLFLVYDESHYLIPIEYNKNTPPKRIDWIRNKIIDRDIGCAFCATPQSHKHSFDRFVRETGHAMEQWFGRIPNPVTLPEELSREDMLAVAGLKFPRVSEGLLKIIVGRIMKSEGFLKSIEHVVKYADFLAGDNELSLDHVYEALDRILPSKSGVNLSDTLQVSRNVSAGRVQIRRGSVPENREFPNSDLVQSD